MSQISKETYKKSEVEIIDKGRYFWINRRDLEVESDYDNWAQIFDKFYPEKQQYRYELTSNTKCQPCRRFVRNDLAKKKKKIKRCRKASQEFLKFKEKLGLDSYKITWFAGEIIHTQYCIVNKRLDAYRPKYNFGIEIDEYDHEYKDSEYKDSKYERSRQLMIESYGINVIRTNADAADFNMDRLINQVYMHIIKSTKKQTEKSTKKSLTDDLSKRLLELEFKSNNPIKSKCLEWIVKKNTTYLIKNR